ncbi:MAG: linear amide C-N hydrolase [Ruminococcaceae bacterium]|nr:linear amide C-N hydrolase [Oscillospiraceae bacterium]
MCTAISLMGLAGRTLDLECSFGEEVAVTPVGFRRKFIFEGERQSHHALIGVAHIHNGTPLYYDAMSDAGLYMAALNFPKCAVYQEHREGKINLASAELIPYILGECANLSTALAKLREVNITPDGVMGLPVTELHWFLTDGSRSIVIEPMANGVEITENPHEVLANSPNIAYHMTKMADFSSLSPTNPKILEKNTQRFPLYSRGMGALGLPGDYSSSSRFIRAAFLVKNIKEFGTINPQNNENNSNNENIFTQISDKIKINANNSPQKTENAEYGKISAFFHLADSLAVPYGAVLTDEGRAVYTVYTSCADLSRRIYYLTTYHCRTPRMIALTEENSSLHTVKRFALSRQEKID